jgi:hypothetical protein
MIGFLDDAISNAFCDLPRVEALKHKIEKDGSQRIASVGYGPGARHARLANPHWETILLALQPSGWERVVVINWSARQSVAKEPQPLPLL